MLGLSSDEPELRERLERIEQKLDALLAFFRVPPTAAGGEWMEEVRAFVAKGQIIQAIKVYREHTGTGLKEAKDAVEAMRGGGSFAP